MFFKLLKSKKKSFLISFMFLFSLFFAFFLYMNCTPPSEDDPPSTKPPTPGSETFAAFGSSLEIQNSQSIPENVPFYGVAYFSKEASSCLKNFAADPPTACENPSQYTPLKTLPNWLWNESKKRYEYTLSKPFMWCSFVGGAFFSDKGKTYGPYSIHITKVPLEGNYDAGKDTLTVKNLKTLNGDGTEARIKGCVEVIGLKPPDKWAEGYCSDLGHFEEIGFRGADDWERDVNNYTYTLKNLKTIVTSNHREYFLDACGEVDFISVNY